MKNLNIIAATIISVVMLATSAFAQDFQKGSDAFDAGDYATALQEWRPLAEQGDADVQTLVGAMYSNGKGVPQDYTEAVKWYLLAAEQGDAKAQTDLGVMYADGDGVTQDYKEAANWYRLAAEQGYDDAQTGLGFTYVLGEGVPQDNVLAHMWFNLGATNGNETAANNRDSIAKEMTPQAIEQAQKMASECMSNNYKNCGY